jgi:predicted neuraminidase
MNLTLLAVLSLGWPASDPLPEQPKPDGLVREEFIFTEAPFASCHASTIVETTKGTLVAAWFGGTNEGRSDVAIWASRLVDAKWTKPEKVADGVESADERFPCWNPVLFQPKDEPLVLFYKVGPNPRGWWGMTALSRDEGKTWAHPTRMHKSLLGPIKNKPVQLDDGVILIPSSTEDKGWRVHFERIEDKKATATDPLNDGKEIAAIQPTILLHKDGRVQALGRSRQGKIWQAWSKDKGKTWSALELTSLPNPNSGIDAVTLADGRFLLVYNHSTKDRSPLNVAVSDDGKNWKAAGVLESEPGEYSYPAVIQSADGLVHITYTWKRERIKHVVLNPKKLTLAELPEEKSDP